MGVNPSQAKTNPASTHIWNIDPTFEQEHLGNFSQMQILEILPNGGCRLRSRYMLSKTESFSSQGL